MIGKRGQKGPKGPLANNDVMAMVVKNFEEVYREFNVHVKWISKMQSQLNSISTTLGSRPER